MKVTDEHRTQRWLVAANIAGLGIVAGQGFSRFTFGLLFPRMGATLVGSTSTSSLLAAQYAAAYLIGVALLIYTTRHVAPLRLLALGVGTSAVGLFLLGGAHSRIVVSYGLVITGLGAAFTYVPALSFVGAAVHHERRARATGLAGAGIGAGIIIARLFAAIFDAQGRVQGWREVWIGEGIIAVVVTILVVVYSSKVPSSVRDRGMPMAVTFRMPHWLPLSMAYFCFGLDYSIFSNLAVKGWELSGLSQQWAANALLFVAPAQIGGGFLTLWFARRVGVGRTTAISFIMLSLAMVEVSLKAGFGFAVIAALLLGFVGAGITAQFVLIVRSRLSPLELDRDATTTVFGMMTLLYSIGGLAGLTAGTQLARGHGELSSTFIVGALVALVGVILSRVGSRGLT